MTEPVDATSPAGEMDTNYIPPALDQVYPVAAWALEEPPAYDHKPTPSRIKEILLPAILCTAIGAAVAAAATHYTTKPTPPPGQALVSAPAQQTDDNDQRYLRALAEHGISTYGVGATSHIFRAYGHQICYAFSPPGPQPYPQVVNSILAQQLELSKVAGYTLPIFSYEDSSRVVDAALDIYCPELRPAG